MKLWLLTPKTPGDMYQWRGDGHNGAVVAAETGALARDLMAARDERTVWEDDGRNVWHSETVTKCELLAESTSWPEGIVVDSFNPDNTP